MDGDIAVFVDYCDGVHSPTNAKGRTSVGASKETGKVRGTDRGTADNNAKITPRMDKHLLAPTEDNVSIKITLVGFVNASTSTTVLSMRAATLLSHTEQARF